METLLLQALLLSLMCSTTQAQASVLSAADVIRLVRTEDPTARATRDAVMVARASEVEAGMYANPSVAWEREHLPGEGEDALLVTVPIDLSSARSTREHLAGVDVAQANAHAAKVTRQAVVNALTSFYQLQAYQKQSAIESQAVERLNEAARVVRRRREEGSASGYDQSRIEIEAELAASNLRQTRARAERLHAALALSLGQAIADVRFEGTLEADETISPNAPSSANDTVPASLRLLRTAVERAARAREGSTTAWLPQLVLSGGPRTGSAQTDGMGYELGVALELPLFARGQDLSARASARERFAQAHAEAAERAATIERARATERVSAARQEALRFAETTANRIELLERAAQSGYREGALSIVELLDAQKTRTHLEMRQLALALAVKEAEVALCASRGEYE